MYSEGTFICFSFLIIGMEPHFLISAGSSTWRGPSPTVNLKVENTAVDKISLTEQF